jgi:hypothetical protein
LGFTDISHMAPFNFSDPGLKQLRLDVEKKLRVDLSSLDGVVYLLLAQQRILSELVETVQDQGKILKALQTSGRFVYSVHNHLKRFCKTYPY